MSLVFKKIRSWFANQLAKEIVADHPLTILRKQIKDEIHCGDEVVICFKDLESRYGKDMPRRIELDESEKRAKILKGTVTGKKLITGPTDCWMLEVSRIRMDPTGNKRMKTVVFLEDEIATLHHEHHKEYK